MLLNLREGETEECSETDREKVHSYFHADDWPRMESFARSPTHILAPVVFGDGKGLSPRRQRLGMQTGTRSTPGVGRELSTVLTTGGDTARTCEDGVAMVLW